MSEVSRRAPDRAVRPVKFSLILFRTWRGGWAISKSARDIKNSSKRARLDVGRPRVTDGWVDSPPNLLGELV
jgi:hypothetical protein